MLFCGMMELERVSEAFWPHNKALLFPVFQKSKGKPFIFELETCAGQLLLQISLLRDRITSTQCRNRSYLLLIRSTDWVALTSFDESIYKMAKQINYFLINIVCLIHRNFQSRRWG